MSRLTVLVSVLIIPLHGVAAPAIDAANQATPPATSLATRDNEEALDLPAMVLQRADLVAAGLDEEFGIFSGKLFELAESDEGSLRGDE